MEVLARLHDDHHAIERQVARFEALLNQSTPATPVQLDAILDHLARRLPAHISFEEAHFYAPLRTSGQSTQEVVALLAAEHEDLLTTLEQLKQLRHRELASSSEAFRAYGFHLIAVYREHTEREHRWLFPLLEQPPPVAASESDRPPRPARLPPVEGSPLAQHRAGQAGLQTAREPGGASRPVSLITKEMTLNTLIRRFPGLLHVLHTLRLDYRWFGSDTLEEAAWYHGIQVEGLLEELNRAIATPGQGSKGAASP